MTDKTIRVGFVGAGANSRKHHIPKLGAQPGVELAAVANRTKASGEQVAKEFGLYTKITGGQRVDLFGARLEQLPNIWRDLIAAGFESGHAYGKALRTGPRTSTRSASAPGPTPTARSRGRFSSRASTCSARRAWP